MKKKHLFLPLAACLVTAACGRSDGNSNQVISKRYIHKYGYAVSQNEWETNQYPGQILTTLRNGVTITSTYENGVLHGPCTHTHPHSQTVQYFYLYNFGDLKKEVSYSPIGMPIKERTQLSPNRYSVTMWYADGNPMSVEDFIGEELLDGQYFTLSNEIESKVERGSGLRTRRNQQGLLLSKDLFDSGYLVKQEAFYANGNMESITLFKMNKREGERRVFTPSGDPISLEEWIANKLHGKATYYVNGLKQVETYYLNGAKNGLEVHYIDGKEVEEEILWNNDVFHGPRKFYVGNALAKTEWYYNGKQVSQKKYADLELMESMITQAASEFKDSDAVR